MNYCTMRSFDRTVLENYPVAKRKKGQKKGKTSDYIDVICAFDIETTRLVDHDNLTFMYIWQFCIGTDYLIYGRTWEEFRTLLHYLSIAAPNGCRWLIFVHNLSYEFQFLRGLYKFSGSEVFCIKSRKILKAVMKDTIEFRCSYILTNMSLDEFTHKMNVEHSKLKSKKDSDSDSDSDDAFDYNKTRYPWTLLYFKELLYAFYDVIGLVESIYKLMEIEGDNIYSLPHTSTGYVRRDAKKAMEKIPSSIVKNILPDENIYRILREAFRGGNTHANRYFVKEIDGETQQIIDNVKSADRSSSYPDVLCNCPFPTSPFVELKAPYLSLTYLRVSVNRRIPFLARIKIEGLQLRDKYEPIPYLSVDKSRNLSMNHINDNGRLLEADYLETTVTDIDFRIIDKMYKYEKFEVTELHVSSYGKLPTKLIEVIEYYYIKKTELKDVEGMEVYYMKSKNKLNSIYGMMAQDIGKFRTIFCEGSEKLYAKEEDVTLQEILDKNNTKAFLAYQWGVWCTAWARLRLQEGIDLAGHNCIYVDTDSVKYIGEVDWSSFNRTRVADSIDSGAYATDKHGITHYMGVYEMETPYKKFSTMGAKKYAYIQEKKGKDVLGITIAGVSKKKGGKELEKLENFQEGFTFVKAGGVELKYCDYPSAVVFNPDGNPSHNIEITPYVAICPSTYTLGISADYDRLLSYLLSEYDDVNFKL